MRPPEKACPPPDTLTCQLKSGSFLPPFDWYGPATLRLTGCWSCATPRTSAVMLSVMSALGMDVLKALSISARASALLPPPPPPQPATSAADASRAKIRAVFVCLRNGSFLQVKGGNVGGEGTSRP